MKSLAPTVLLVVVVLAANGSGLGNGFVQDDLSVIAENPVVHSLSNLPTIFSQPYWPKPYPAANYRPLASTAFALQWTLVSGEPWVFRLTSLGALLGVVLLLYHVVARVVARPFAWFVAALFAVHPVHVEAVALGVNQGELVVGAMALALIARLLDHDPGTPFGARSIAGLGLFFATAVLFKENGLVLIALPVIMALLLRPGPNGIRASVRPVLAMAVVMVLFLLARRAVLGGDLVGTPSAEALKGLSAGDRALTMLGVVPEWTRLLLWPANLAADYSPSQILPAHEWGGPQALGALIVLLWLAGIVAAWRRAPVVAFGLVWVAIGIFPVSNLVAPTGVVLAERTLFLPSIGVGFIVAGLLHAWVVPGERSRVLRLALAGVGAVLIVAGASRSTSRYRVWRDQLSLWRQTAIDSPRSYRAHHALAQLLFREGQRVLAEQHFRLAVEYSIGDWGPAADFADRLRDAGLYGAAAGYYQRALALEPRHEGVRNKLVVCLLAVRRYAEALTEARLGAERASRPEIRAVFERLASRADSGLESLRR